MTDKGQIMIDGVDVNECEFYRPYYCAMYVDGYGDTKGNCRDYEDCYFKQLVRKTQECEDLKLCLQQTKDNNKSTLELLANKHKECEKLENRNIKLEKKLELIPCTDTVLQIGYEAYKKQTEYLLNENTRYRKALEPFQDEYFKDLDTTVIAELAKKSIRLTTENTKLEEALEDIKGLILSTLDDFEEDDEEMQLSYCHDISRQVLDIISKLKDKQQ